MTHDELVERVLKLERLNRELVALYEDQERRTLALCSANVTVRNAHEALATAEEAHRSALAVAEEARRIANSHLYEVASGSVDLLPKRWELLQDLMEPAPE